MSAIEVILGKRGTIMPTKRTVGAHRGSTKSLVPLTLSFAAKKKMLGGRIKCLRRPTKGPLEGSNALDPRGRGCVC